MTVLSRPPEHRRQRENNRSACSKLAALIGMFGDVGATCGGPANATIAATNAVFPSPVAALPSLSV